MATDSHLLHKVPVDQGIWISKVDCVVLFFRDNKLAVGLQEELLVERLMSPLVPFPPVAMSIPIKMACLATGFKSEVQ